MQAIDILKQATEMLSLNEENAILHTITKENEAEIENQDVKKIINIFKIVLNDFCTHYMPILTTQNIQVKNNSFPVSELKDVYKIKNIKKGNFVVHFKLINKNIVIENGNFTVNYYSLPSVNSIFDELNFLAALSPDVLVFGLCAFYCLSVGLFDEFKIYNEKYKSKAEAIKNLQNFEIPQRMWK